MSYWACPSFPHEVLEPQAFREGFWGRVDMSLGQGPNGECWEWRGAMMTGTGYGQIVIKGKKRGAHRVAWALANGRSPLPEEHVCHRCDNPVCVRPDHLWLGSRTENMRDMIKKDRWGGTAKANAAKTHCINGHEYTEENTYRRPRGGKDCRKCIVERGKKYARRSGSVCLSV